MHLAKVTLLSVLLVTSVAASAQTKSQGDLILSMRGIGPVKLGMTVKAASAAGGTPITKVGDPTLGIEYKTYMSKDASFSVGAKDGLIHIACANSDRVSTAEGIRKGDSVKKLGQFPRAKLKHMHNPMHYQLQPTDPRDRGFVIWFEVLGDKIEEICAGTSTVHSYVMEGGT